MLDSITSAISGIGEFGRSLGHFASGLNSRETWTRVVLVALGCVLILAVLLRTAGGI